MAGSEDPQDLDALLKQANALAGSGTDNLDDLLKQADQLQGGDDLDSLLQQADQLAAESPQAEPTRTVLDNSPARSLFEVFNQSLLQTPQGSGRVTDVAVNTDQPVSEQEMWKQRSPAGYRGDFLWDRFRLTFPNTFFGRTPNAADFDRAANEFADFKPIWDKLRARQKMGVEYQMALHGDKPNWNQIQQQAIESMVGDLQASGQVAPNKSPARASQPFEPITPPDANQKLLKYVSGKPAKESIKDQAIPLPESPFDQQLNDIRKAVYDGIPGVTRPPLTDEEITQQAVAEIVGVAAQQQEALPTIPKYAAKGLGSGIRMGAEIAPVGKAARAMGAVGKVVAPLLEGAAASAADQGLRIATGAQQDFSVGDVVEQAALMGLGAKAGRSLATRFPESAKLMSTVGTLGTVEVANKTLQTARTHRYPLEGSKDPLGDMLGGIIETAVSIGVAGKMGGAESGKPEDQAGLAKEAQVRKLRNFIDSAKTEEALTETLRAKFGMNPDKVKIDSIERESIKQTLDATVQSIMAQREYDAALTDAVGEKPTTFASDSAKAALHLDVLRQLEASDKPVEDRPFIVSGFKPEVVDGLVDRLKKFGEAGLKIGQIQMERDVIPEVRLRPVGGPADGSQDISIKKSEIDSGDAMVPETADQPAQPVERGAVPDGWELVGGYDYHAKRGFYYPQMSPPTDLAGQPSSWTGPAKRAPGNRTLAQQHTRMRENEFEKALQERALDISTNSAAKVFEDQAGLVRDKTFLDLARQEGLILRGDEKDNAANIEQAQLDMDALKQRNAALEEAIKQKVGNPLEQQQNVDELLANKRQMAVLKQIIKGDFYKQAVGKKRNPDGSTEWGDYEGMWMHPEVMYRARRTMEGRTPWGHLLNVVNSSIKGNLVGSNLRTFLQDATGNYIAYEAAGVDTASRLGQAEKIENWESQPKATRKGDPRDQIDVTFDVLAKRSALGGPTDITARDLQEMTRIERDLADAKERGDPTTVLRLARALEDIKATGKAINEKAGVTLPDALGGARIGLGTPLEILAQLKRPANWLGNKRIHLVDRAQARAAFRTLVEDGIDGSGPLDPVDAFNYIRRISDYGTLPGFINRIAGAFSMIRYPSKVVQSFGAVMARRPSIFGEPVPTPFDAVIEAHPGSTPAQRALIARGLTRMATTAMKYAIPIAGLSQAAGQMVGVTPNQMDRYLDEKLKWMSPQARWLTKKFAIPYNKRADGTIDYIDAASWFPPVVAMRYFWINASSDTQPWFVQALQQLAQKNVVAGPLTNVAMREDFSGKNVSAEEQFKPFIQALTPAMVAQPMEAYFQMTNTPEDERNVLRAVLRTSLGVPLEMARDPDTLEKILLPSILEYFHQGVIGREVRDDGTGGYYVRSEFRDSLEGQDAAKRLADYSKLYNANPTVAVRKLDERLKNLGK